MNIFAKVFVFLFCGCAIVKSEKLGCIGRWYEAVRCNEREMFYSCQLSFPIAYDMEAGYGGEGFGSGVEFVAV